MTENNRQQDIKLITDVIDVRITAIGIAGSTNNAALYAAAIANDDEAVVTILDELVSETEAKVAEKHEAIHHASATLVDHMITMNEWRNASERLELLTGLRDTARANVALITSGEVCYPPANKPTQQLLENLKVLTEAEEVVASAKAG